MNTERIMEQTPSEMPSSVIAGTKNVADEPLYSKDFIAAAAAKPPFMRDATDKMAIKYQDKQNSSKQERDSPKQSENFTRIAYNPETSMPSNNKFTPDAFNGQALGLEYRAEPKKPAGVEAYENLHDKTASEAPLFINNARARINESTQTDARRVTVPVVRSIEAFFGRHEKAIGVPISAAREAWRQTGHAWEVLGAKLNKWMSGVSDDANRAIDAVVWTMDAAPLAVEMGVKGSMAAGEAVISQGAKWAAAHEARSAAASKAAVAELTTISKATTEGFSDNWEGMTESGASEALETVKAARELAEQMSNAAKGEMERALNLKQAAGKMNRWRQELADASQGVSAHLEFAQTLADKASYKDYRRELRVESQAMKLFSKPWDELTSDEQRRVTNSVDRQTGQNRLSRKAA